MLIKLLFIAALATSAISRHVPRYADLDEEDQVLFRAAYDAPYEQDNYEEEEAPGKLDLLKDGVLALKTKFKEMKLFNKALAAHLLATKLQVKELLGSLKKPHIEIEKKKPVYHYQSPPSSSYHEPPHYSAPAPSEQYDQHAPPQYSQSQYTPPKYEPAKYEPPKYEPPKYEPPAPALYPQVQYASNQNAAPAPSPQYGHDPYYGY